LGKGYYSSSGKGLQSTSISSSPTLRSVSFTDDEVLPSRTSGSDPQASNDPLPTSTDKSKLSEEKVDGENRERESKEGDTCKAQQEKSVGDVEPVEQGDFDFRLSMLPEWAQKAALSRPSVALASKKISSQKKDNQPQAKGAAGRWEEVSGCVVMVGGGWVCS